MKLYDTLADIQRDLSTGLLTCSDLVDFYLGRINAQPEINAFVEVFSEEAKSAAALVDEKLRAGTAGKLAGLVLGIKDVLCYKGHGLTASSTILNGFESMITATVVERLLAEDAIIIGRQNCDEFAMGSSNENSTYGPVRNPVDPSRVPGGSSGGSAAAVKAGMCHASLGSDTGGSVRQPATFCGLVGLKPTYGRVSRWGLIAYASSFDQIGPITRSVEDAALLLSFMAGPDGKDNTASTQPVPDYLPLKSMDAPRKIGYLKEVLESPGLDQEIKRQQEALLQACQEAGHEVVELTFPLLKYLVPCYYILTTAEASSNLSRYDGVHYGHRSSEGEDLASVYLNSRSEGFGEEVQRRIMLGTFVLSAGYADDYYLKAMKVRRLIREQSLTLLETCDVLLTPTTPTPAFQIGEKTEDPVEMFLSDVFTVHANLAGLPAISFPWGTHSTQLPIGMQLMGRPFEEAALLTFAEQLSRLKNLPKTD
ncbi:MAG: Asp-tRNA(Asn)/Glu-tRNA(Gln) amidotransferase subunit GatA [Bacteroidota bacterium]